MVALLRYAFVSNPRLRLIPQRGFHQNWNMYISSRFLANMHTLRYISLNHLHPLTSVHRLSTNSLLFAHVQGSKHMENHSGFPIWCVNPVENETQVPRANKTPPPNLSVQQPPAKEPEERKVQKSGEQAHAKDITRFSKLFEDQVTLDSLDNKQLRMLCRLLSLPTIGPSHLLRFQIWIRVRQLKAEDKLIANEGVDQIPPWELQSLCQERGMRSVGLPKEKLQSQLSEWLDLHLEKNVPITLLLFSRALHVTQALVDQNPLQQAIAQLPPSASSEAVARVLETTPHDELDPVTKIKVLREEQDSIKAERVQRKQELIEKQKSEKGKTGLLEGDQAPLLKGLKNEELDKVTPVLTDSAAFMSENTEIQPEIRKHVQNIPPIHAVQTAFDGKSKDDSHIDSLSMKPEKPKTSDTEEVTEISAGDLAEIHSAIAESTPHLDSETIDGLKEQVAKTAKLQQKRQAELLASEEVTDKRKSKAALHLESRVENLIKEMDTMVDKLNDKRTQLLKDIEVCESHINKSTESKERSKIMDQIKADHDRMVDINDLLVSLKRIRNIPDDTRWEKILKVLDEDRDGKIELNHVLSVIELLGSENVKLSSKEIARVLEMIDNEHLAEEIPTEDLKADKNRLKSSVDHSQVTSK
ncbi:unnamed protein product [Schistosoma rodhaini]|nr:unnamed protein product [Schistosoma rodhaini]